MEEGSRSTVAKCGFTAGIHHHGHTPQTNPVDRCVCMLHRAIVLHTAEAVCWKDHPGSCIITVRVYLFLVHNVFSRVEILSLWNVCLQFQSNTFAVFYT